MSNEKRFINTIENKKFNTVKNATRDYYIYGFSQKGNNANWKLLSQMLHEKWKDGAIIEKDSTETFENPFLELFRFHRPSASCTKALNVLMELDPGLQLVEGINSLPPGQKFNLDEYYKRLDVMVDAYLNNREERPYLARTLWYKQLINASELPEYYRWEKLRDSEMLLYTTTITDGKEDVVRSNNDSDADYLMKKHEAGKHRYKALEKIMNPLVELGFVSNMSDPYNIPKRDAFLADFEKFNLKDNFILRRKKKLLNLKKKGSNEKYYKKSPITMEWLVEDEFLPEDFTERFYEFLSFYESYGSLGEVGTLLKRRILAAPVTAEYHSSIKFKNHRLITPVYDVLLLDFLNSIEKGYYCVVHYKKEHEDKESSALIAPLEIRISAESGRKYIVFYDLINENINAMRLDFIEKIQMITADELFRCSESKKIKLTDSIYCKESEHIVLDDELEKNTLSNLEKAREMLKLIVGTEFPGYRVTDNFKKGIKKAVLELTEDESNVFSARYAEATQGKTIHLEMMKTKEFRPYVRKHCGTVKKVIYPENSFATKEHNHLTRTEYEYDFDDFDAMYNLYYGDGELDFSYKLTKSPKESQNSVQTVEAHEYEGHSSLFNQYYSVYTEIIADAILNVTQGGDAKDIDKYVDDRLKKLENGLDDSEVESIRESIRDQFDETYLLHPQYKLAKSKKQISYLYNFLPFGKLEIRWLLASLDNKYAAMFLTDAEMERIRNRIKEAAPFEAKPFCFDAINYYDQKKRLGDQKDIISNGKIIIDAIHVDRQIEITKSDGETERISPVCITYSDYSNTFTLVGVKAWGPSGDNSNAEKKWINVPLHEITSVEVVEDLVRDRCDSLGEEPLCSVTVEFGNQYMISDRILNEMSAFKKECVYMSKQNRFEMTIYYSGDDYLEIVERLLGYGCKIKILRGDARTIGEFHSRLIKQHRLKVEKTQGGNE